ncbi:MAG: hypothetical protein AAGI03_16205, partial [Pseudomonadota bacterium]
SRWQRIEKMIDEMQETGEVWFATMEEIARHCLACRDAGSWSPREVSLPHYGGTSPLPEPLPSSMPGYKALK